SSDQVKQITHLQVLVENLFLPYLPISPNARLRGWQRITLNPNTTTATTAAQWDWKRHALTVPLEAFVMCLNTLILQ
ncbi:hypothetical protein, partial [Vibrio cholerae]|uniref:hypothetical protein n=1 Tax=Vibrio cholerae TaxID=666 RepID=UPI001C8D5643